MHEERLLLQPGVMFLDAWRACMMVQGVSMAEFARQHDVGVQVLRQIATGSINGPRGKSIREKMIEAAGRDLMLRMVRERWLREDAQ